MAWLRACSLDQLEEGKPWRIRLEAMDLMLTRFGQDEVHALSNVCLHRGAPLSGGETAEGMVTCNLHFWQFDLKDGHCVQVPSIVLKNYPSKIEEGAVFVEIDA